MGAVVRPKGSEMATETPILVTSLEAEGDLSSSQYYAVTVDGNGRAALAGLGAEAFGILQNDPEDAENAAIMCLGRSKAKLGGTVNAGDSLGVDAAGKLIVATWHPVVARALVDGVANDIASVFLVPAGKARPVRTMVVYQGTLAGLSVDGNVRTGIVMGFPGRIVKFTSSVDVVASTGGKGCAINAEIATVDVTGGVLTLTTDNQDTRGETVESTAVTAGGDFTATDAIDIEVSGSTQFSQGEATITMFYQ